MLRMIVIYTGDIERRQVTDEYNIGAVRVTLELAFLSELDSVGIYRQLEEKVERNALLEDEELMKLIIWPLSYRKREEKEEKIRESINLAAKIRDRNQQLFALAGLLAFTDKVIDMDAANKIRRMIEMTKVGWIIEQEIQQAVEKAVEKAIEEKRQAARESVIRMIRKNYPTEEIAFIVPSFSHDEIEALRKEMAEAK